MENIRQYIDLNYVKDLYLQYFDVESETLVFGSIITAVIVVLLYQYIKHFHRKSSYINWINRRNGERIMQIEQMVKSLSKDGVLVTPERQTILNTPTAKLLQQLKDGIVKPTEVLEAYQSKAVEVTKKINCVTLFIYEAKEWSEGLELITDKEKFPLYGLPVSLKEDFAIAKYDVTMGCSKFLGEFEKEDSAVVKALKKLGAVPFCRTNVPQTQVSFCCSNPVYGATKHPTHHDRCPGGSSGGEGALIASGGSMLGFGSDTAGSVRIPAHFCGIASLKPTSGRLSMKGESRNFQAPPGIRATSGVFGRDVETVTIGAKSLISSALIHEYDPYNVPLPWREEILLSKRKLRIGYYDSNYIFPTTPGCRRAVHVAIKALQAAGHEVVPFPLTGASGVMKNIIKLILSDGGRFYQNMLRNERVDSNMWLQYVGAFVPEWLKRLVIPMASHSSEMWDCLKERYAFSHEYIKEWKALELDVCIAPGFATPAVAQVFPTLISVAIAYTIFYNYLDFPVGMVPVTKESAKDQKDLDQYKTRGDIMLVLAKLATRGAEGLPLGVQVVGLPWEEEMVVRVMKELQDSLKPIESV